MVLTNERADLISNYLMSDTEKSKALFELSAEEATKKINADGNDFSVDEIKEYGVQLQRIADSQNGETELNPEKLDEVTGGAFVTLTAVGMAKVFSTCVVAGWAMANRHNGW